MKQLGTKKYLILGLAFFLLVGVGVLIAALNRQQDTRTQAQKSTTLSFSPNTSQSSPLQKKVGENVAFDIKVTPNQNYVTLIHLEIRYDPAKLEPVATPFDRNADAFPSVLDAVAITSGKIETTISVGSDPTQAIREPTSVGTLTLKAISPTDINTLSGVTEITFEQTTEVLSAGPLDEAAENVLNQRVPAYVAISATVTPTQQVSPTIQPTGTRVPTQQPSPTIQPTATIVPTQTSSEIQLNFSLFLHGIGNSGDNANPTAHSLSNKNPQRPERDAVMELTNSKNVTVATTSGIITYNQANGNFTGSVTFNTTNISVPQDEYIVKIKTPRSLKKYFPGIFSLKPNNAYTLPPMHLVAGDADNNNTLNILDYNQMRDCYSDANPPISCNAEKKLKTDFNDDAKVNQYDYNLLLREISVQYGD
jgi:hypothetical protein